MSEVKRYEFADFDRVTAERDAALGREAALREELDKVCGDEWRKDKRRIVEMQQRLTAADERADVLEGLLRRTSTRLREGGRIGWEDRAADRIDAALKPAEGRGDEVICLLCMDTKTVGGSGGKFPRDCPDCCGEEG